MDARPAGILFLLFLLLLPFAPGCSTQQSPLLSVTALGDLPGTAEAPAGLSSLTGFVENRGQWPEEVLFHARADGAEATLWRNALAFRPAPGASSATPARPLVLRLPGDMGPRAIEGREEFPTRHHFLLASGSASDVPGWRRVVYRDVLPGIDVQVRVAGGRFEYDLLLEPHADLASFVLEVEGADALEIVDEDLLAIHTPSGTVEQQIHASWQVDPEEGERESIPCRFRLLEGTEDGLHRFGFEAPGWDQRLALVLDPSLVFGTYVGGVKKESFRDMAVDAAGASYLLCLNSGETPTTPGSFQQEVGGLSDVWVGKLSPDGSTLEWGTFLGGSLTEDPATVLVDADGSVVVVGNTWSSDFPTTPESYQPLFGGKTDVFVARLDPTGSSLLWSTYFGGPEIEAIQGSSRAATLLPSGDVAVAFEPWTGDVPITAGAFDEFYDPGDKVVFRLSVDGATLVFSTFFKTSGIFAMAADGESNIYFTGVAGVGTQIPTTAGAFQEQVGGGSPMAFVTKMNPWGTGLGWSTYLGGEIGTESGWGIAVDAASSVYVTGSTHSSDFPVTPGAFATENSGTDGFVTKLLPDGSGLAWSTYLGACCGGSGFLTDLAVDAAGNVHVVGSANEHFFPTTPDAFQSSYIGPWPSQGDATLTKLDAFGETLVYSTWFGGTGSQTGTRVGLDGNGHPLLGLHTSAVDMAVTPGAYQTTPGGSQDMFVAKFDLPLLPWRVLGGGLKGAKDTPNLAGGGPLTAGSIARLSVRGAAESAPAWLVAGFSQVDIPFLGGTLVPFPTIALPLATDGGGAIDLVFPWPPSSPATLAAQIWILDPGAPQGWSATNALELHSQ